VEGLSFKTLCDEIFGGLFDESQPLAQVDTQSYGYLKIMSTLTGHGVQRSRHKKIIRMNCFL
jgi:hypothetical protein